MMEHPQRAASGRRNPRSEEAPGGEYGIMRIWLLAHRRQNLRMTMALVERRVGRQAIEITLAFGIPHPHAFTPSERDVERLVVARSKTRLDGVQIAGR